MIELSVLSAVGSNPLAGIIRTLQHPADWRSLIQIFALPRNSAVKSTRARHVKFPRTRCQFHISKVPTAVMARQFYGGFGATAFFLVYTLLLVLAFTSTFAS